MPILLKPSVSGRPSSTASPTSNALGAVIFALLLCGIGLYFFLPGLSHLHEWQELERVGRTTTGTVVDHQKVSGKSARTSLTCDYTVKSKQFSEVEYVRPGFYNRVNVGESIPITYSPSHPALFRTAGSLKNSMAIAGIIGGVLCFLVTVALLVQAIVFLTSASSQPRS